LRSPDLDNTPTDASQQFRRKTHDLAFPSYTRYTLWSYHHHVAGCVDLYLASESFQLECNQCKFPVFCIFPFACSHRFDLSNRHEHAKVQLLLMKFNTRTPGKKTYLELQRCRFRNLRSSISYIAIKFRRLYFLSLINHICPKILGLQIHLSRLLLTIPYIVLCSSAGRPFLFSRSTRRDSRPYRFFIPRLDRVRRSFHPDHFCAAV